MDPLPPPTTTSSRALLPRQHGSRSRSATASRTSSRSASAAPREPDESTARHDTVETDRLDSEPAEPRAFFGDIDLRTEPTTRGRPEGGTTGDRTPSPGSAADDDRPRKRRRLLDESTALVAAALPELFDDADNPGPSSRPHGGSPPQRTERGASPSTPAFVPIDVDALPDLPVLLRSSPRVLGTADRSFEENEHTSGSLSPAGSSPEPSLPPLTQLSQSSRAGPEPLNSYVCPICFSPPTYPSMTPCGHVCCGDCLFSAVRATIERSAYHGPASQRAKCPVCRAPIPGWDGHGRGVIGLKPRVVFTVDSAR